ncbi:MAG TPA: hypothetical protein VF179_03070 [Thermoanaerobaculia bacterium]|nr:hypothetical protein [Thermoanaerobaculia bacterium]
MKSNAILLALILLALPAAGAVDPFYQSLLREGVLAFDRGDYAASSRTLRIACFGMLDEPRALAGCLSRLALAQDRNDDSDGFQDTFRRLAEVEERFQAYTGAELPAETRAALEQRLVARIPAATLRSIPVFRPLADRKEVESAESAQSTRPADPKPRRGQADPPPASSPPRVTAAPAPAESTPTGPAEPRVLTAAERDKMAEARRLLGQESKVKDLRQAYDLAREVADAHAESVEAQHLAAEAAYRISRWADAARYFRRGGEPGENQPELQFYMAVSLFESGDAAGAAAILRRSLPNLQRSPYVDEYARKILG